MTDKSDIITLETIGLVRNNIREPMEQGWENIASDIVIRDDLVEALDGLDEFSHIVVLYWMHRVRRGHFSVKIHPRRRQDLPLVGLFATRTPARPNPIGLTVAKLLERQRNVLKVIGLDAIDDTPVIDIKPYIPHYGSIVEARAPEWVGRL